ncbi:unnamed protein product, partial [Ascophyllum nodosum]
MVAKLLLKEKEKEIKEECAAAIEKAQRKERGHPETNATRKRPRTGEASGGAVSATSPARRVTRRSTKRNPGALDEEFRGNLFGLSPEPRRSRPRCRAGEERGVHASDRRNSNR